MKKRRELAMKHLSKGADIVFKDFYVGMDPRNRDVFYKRFKDDSCSKNIELLHGCMYTLAGNKSFIYLLID
jgi:hypothetical protein